MQAADLLITGMTTGQVARQMAVEHGCSERQIRNDIKFAREHILPAQYQYGDFEERISDAIAKAEDLYQRCLNDPKPDYRAAIQTLKWIGELLGLHWVQRKDPEVRKLKDELRRLRELRGRSSSSLSLEDWNQMRSIYGQAPHSADEFSEHMRRHIGSSGAAN